MPRIHLLTASNPDVYQVVIHSPTPAGANDASVTWVEAVKNSGLNITTMAIGSGSGQITSSEATLVSCGALIETRFAWQDNPTWLSSQKIQNINDIAATEVANVLASYAWKLKFFGYTASS